jgi:hypothetical protein
MACLCGRVNKKAVIWGGAIAYHANHSSLSCLARYPPTVAPSDGKCNLMARFYFLM